MVNGINYFSYTIKYINCYNKMDEIICKLEKIKNNYTPDNFM